jgi:hypothetical protein
MQVTFTLDHTDDTSVDPNPKLNPECFRVIERIIHLFPLWSCILQNEPELFAEENIAKEQTLNPVLRSNACVESHFKQMKKGRFTGSRKVRPREFAQAELQFVYGKLNERKLPPTGKEARSKGQDISGTQEFWSRKRKPKFEDKSHAVKFFKQTCTKTVKTQRNISRVLRTRQLTSDDMERASSCLRPLNNSFEGLQSTLLGQCAPNVSVPKFIPITDGKRFIQILHTPGHWVTVTNCHTEPPHHVYVFDSMPGHTVTKEILVQTTSLLRLLDKPDKISFHIRNCARQPSKSNSCGYYAIAAASAVTRGQDPTLWRYDHSKLVDHVNKALSDGDFQGCNRMLLQMRN